MTDTKLPDGRTPGMPFEKPAEGWTRKHHLETGDVSYEDSVDPRFHEDEREAVFRRSWLHVGREIQIPEPGDYFTRELPGLNTSLIISRGRDGVVRAFYNMCTHRGNKLLWDENSQQEVCGNARRFQCKYHGWQFDPEGNLRFVNKEQWFFDIDKSDYGLVPVGCDSWEGFIFVNLDPTNTVALREHVAPFADGLAGYPFNEMTQTFWFTCEARANWKIFSDSMVEQYHGNTLHYKLVDQDATSPLRGATGSHFEIYGRNSIWSVAVLAGAMDESVRHIRPMETLFRANLWGQENGPEIGLREVPPLLNITQHPGWTNDMFHVYPNFDMLVWDRGWIMTYTMWPLAVDRMLFDTRMYFPPPRNASDRLAQELVAVEFKEFLLQDANLLECAQSMLSARIKSNFPLNDEEVLIRNNHKSVQDAVEQYRREKAAAGQR